MTNFKNDTMSTMTSKTDMTLDEQRLFFQLFYSTAIGAIDQRARDYAPDGVPLLDLLDTCVDRDTLPDGELWSLFKKQYSAIRRYVAEGRVDSDPIDSRLRDGCNYLAFIGFYHAHRLDLFSAWRTHWMNQRCECGRELLQHPMLLDLLAHQLQPDDGQCQKCRTLVWLTRRWPR